MLKLLKYYLFMEYPWLQNMIELFFAQEGQGLINGYIYKVALKTSILQWSLLIGGSFCNGFDPLIEMWFTLFLLSFFYEQLQFVMKLWWSQMTKSLDLNSSQVRRKIWELSSQKGPSQSKMERKLIWSWHLQPPKENQQFWDNWNSQWKMSTKCSIPCFWEMVLMLNLLKHQ